MAATNLPKFSSINELLVEFAGHMIDTMYEGADHRPRLAAKNRLFRKRLEDLGYGDVVCAEDGYVTLSKDGLHRATLLYESIWPPWPGVVASP